MTTVGWLLVIAVGIALGFSVGRLWPGSSKKIAELERERDAAREDLKDYRQEVGAHFETTAALFDKVTADYRGLYEHLAVGARQLGAIRGESVNLPLAEPEQRRLAATGSVPPPVPDSFEAQPEDSIELPVFKDDEVPEHWSQDDAPESDEELRPSIAEDSAENESPETDVPEDAAPEEEPGGQTEAPAPKFETEAPAPKFRKAGGE